MKAFLGFVVWILVEKLCLVSGAEILGRQQNSSVSRPTRQFAFGVNPFGQSILKSELEDLKDNIPGTPGIDYPIFAEVPKTAFNCRTQNPPTGYFADTQARCQVFHICQDKGRKDSFLCPNGTIFSQKTFVCVWWYEFDCRTAAFLYAENNKIGNQNQEENSIGSTSGFGQNRDDQTGLSNLNAGGNQFSSNSLGNNQNAGGNQFSSNSLGNNQNAGGNQFSSNSLGNNQNAGGNQFSSNSLGNNQNAGGNQFPSSSPGYNPNTGGNQFPGSQSSGFNANSASTGNKNDNSNSKFNDQNYNNFGGNYDSKKGQNKENNSNRNNEESLDISTYNNIKAQLDKIIDIVSKQSHQDKESNYGEEENDRSKGNSGYKYDKPGNSGYKYDKPENSGYKYDKPENSGYNYDKPENIFSDGEFNGRPGKKYLPPGSNKYLPPSNSARRDPERQYKGDRKYLPPDDLDSPSREYLPPSFLI